MPQPHTREEKDATNNMSGSMYMAPGGNSSSSSTDTEDARSVPYRGSSQFSDGGLHKTATGSHPAQPNCHSSKMDPCRAQCAVSSSTHAGSALWISTCCTTIHQHNQHTHTPTDSHTHTVAHTHTSTHLNDESLGVELSRSQRLVPPDGEPAEPGANVLEEGALLRGRADEVGAEEHLGVRS